MTFEPNDPRWTAYVLGELEPRDQAIMDAAVESDPEARAFAASLHDTARLLTSGLEGQPLVGLSELQRRRIEQAARAPRRRRWPSIAALGAAAMAIGALVLFRHESTEAVDSSPPSSAAVMKASPTETTSRSAAVVTRPVAVAPGPATPAPEPELRVTDGSKMGKRGDRSGVWYHSTRESTVNRPPVPPDDSGEFAPMPAQPAGTEQYDRIDEREFVAVADDARSTFSIDVDTASYSNVRRMLVAGQRPPAGAVRIEEMINYFDYAYPPPQGEQPFAIHTETIVAPWNRDHLLLRVGIKSRPLPEHRRAQANLVFLIDVSGSMGEPAKLPLVKQSLGLMLRALDDEDRIAIVVYAGDSGVVLDSTAVADRRMIDRAIEQLDSGGSTNGGAGIRTAYGIAAKHFVEGGINRVILATDGDFNVGVSSNDELIDLIEAQAKTGVFLTVLGFGMGNYKDSTLEQIADRGNGHYGYIDTLNEARKLLVDGLDATLVPVAKDVKIQVEFNPSRVGHYRLIGYENRALAHRDFADDRKDAGDVGAGHAVTALYELVPPGMAVEGATPTESLKYQTRPTPTAAAVSAELLTLKLRYKQPDGAASQLIEQVVFGEVIPTTVASDDTRFAAAIAGFAMLLRGSRHAGDLTIREVQNLAASSLGADPYGYRAEALQLIARFQAMR